MKVLYDISVLASGHVDTKARTGVFRVVENVAEQLIHINTDLRIQFTSSLNPESISAALNYLAQKESFSNTSYLLPNVLAERLAIHERKQKLTESLSDKKNAGKIKLNFWRIYSKMFYLWRDDKYVYKKLLKDNQIYHSPFLPIPKPLHGLHNKAIFLTCYDLIAILFPQYAEQSTVSLIKTVLDSITSDTWVFCISHATRNDLLNYLGDRVNAERVLVTELAASDIFYKSIDSDKNDLVRKKYKISNHPYVLSLCTFEPRKNIEGVIRSFLQMIQQEHIQDLNLVLVGTKGWKFEKIFEEIEAATNLQDRIIVTGFVADEDLAAIYSEAMMFVYPSFYEGFGLPPLEAMKCGIPVITSNISSLPEVVGDAGIMVDPKDLVSLSDKMLQIYKDCALRDQLSSKSLERSAHFSWLRCAQETVKAYKQSVS